MCALRALLFFLLVPVCADAQPAATVVKTLVSTDTSATSICAGGDVTKAPNTCTGGLKSGAIAIGGAADNTGLTITATTTARPAISLSNASTGLLSFIQGTNDLGMVLYANGSSAQVVKLHASGGMSVGNTTDPGDNNLGIAGNATVGSTITVGTGPTISVTTNANTSAVSVGGGTLGTGNRTGALVLVGANSSGGGAAGILNLQGKSVGANYIWADASGTPGVLRISTAPPEEDGTPSDTSGTVVGSQSSTLDTKDVLGPGVAPAEALATMLRTPTFRFTYKGGRYSGTVFDGIAADLSPEFAMDPDAAHPNGRSFNPVSALGYTIQAIKALQAEIDVLREELRRK